MQPQDNHLSDQDLVLAADGELNARGDARVRAHLAACWQCRTRLRGLEGAIADFVRLHSATLDPQLPPAAGPRAMLKARLAEMAPQYASPRRHLVTQTAFAIGLAGLAALIAGTMAAWGIAYFVLDIPLVFAGRAVAFAIAGGAIGTLVLGLSGGFAALAAKPAARLRNSRTIGKSA